MTSAVSQFDPQHRRFRSQPKFPHPAILDLLLQVGLNRGIGEATRAFTITLEQMARGGVYDQLAGGFHRYSVDERWVVPHFEKMIYDNTELLRNYTHAYQSFVREDFRSTAEEIIGWLDAVMTDRERGGFYASQDADINLEDDGDYFTWTLDEASAVLDPDELAVAGPYWDIGDLGDMHHNPAKNVLHRKFTLDEIASQTGKPLADVRWLLSSAHRKLLAARVERPTPFIDETLYTGWNAMAVTVYLEAARVLRAEDPAPFALLTLDRIIAEAWDGEAALRHVVAYGGGVGEGTSEDVPGTLDDYAMTVHACIDGWIATGADAVLPGSREACRSMIAKFYDRTAGAFFDTAPAADGAVPLGALTARRKPLQDSPTPAGNPTAAAALLRLEELSGRKEYRHIAEDTLETFAGIVEHFGLYAGSYGLALERLLLDPVQIVVVGTGAEADQLEALATARYAVNKTVIRISPETIAAGALPDALAETVTQVPKPEDKPAWALVCRGRTCMPPVWDPEGLLKAME